MALETSRCIPTKWNISKCLPLEDKLKLVVLHKQHKAMLLWKAFFSRDKSYERTLSFTKK